MDTTNRRVCELRESSNGQVKVGFGAACTAVHNFDHDGFAFVGDLNLFAADWVSVRVNTVVAGVAVIQYLRNSNDEVLVSSGNATSTQGSLKVCEVTNETGLVWVGLCRCGWSCWLLKLRRRRVYGGNDGGGDLARYRDRGHGCCGGQWRNLGRGRMVLASRALLSFKESSMIIIIIGSYSSCNHTMVKSVTESMWCCEDGDGTNRDDDEDGL